MTSPGRDSEQKRKASPWLIVGLSLAFLLLGVIKDGAASSAFQEGSARLSIFFGTASAFDERYTVFGLGGGYFVADGIEVGLDAETWSGSSPRIQQISPQIRFVLTGNDSVNPYAGAFYRRTHIEGIGDYETVGGRAGVYFPAGRSAYFGAGVVHDVHLNCDREVYATCSETFPEVVAGILF